MTPAPDAKPITLVVDGVEIEANEGAMLVDAAKHGDVEIPVFCYEPKLGEPVGACRMCLVEIEGIPKLQTACSTPVRDGMVVYTQNARVKEAQNAVVEFLLVNHPLDCPVCDKGGECPLQDISMGWGAGRSRVTDPKRHFEKPLPLSPLIKIDRERCILCYRCVRFSQEVAEDEQLQLLERGPKTYVGTFDDRPYVAPFHGNIIELCPVGALTSQAYRFRARPWDIEDAGSVCTLCPSQCNVKFTVRDEHVVRTLARDNADVDDGWLCDKGRFGYQMFSSADRALAPAVSAGGVLGDTTWEDALERAAAGLAGARGKVAAIVGGGTSNEEGYLIQRLVRGPLASADVVSSPAPSLPLGLRRRLADPALSVGMAEIDHAGAILVVGCDPMHEMPILELRIRKAVRRNGSDLLVAGERPTALDGGAAIGSNGALEAQRYAPGGTAAFLDEVRAAVASGDDDNGFAAALRGAESVVVVWSERMLGASGDSAAAESLLGLADVLGLDGQEGGGLLEIPRSANGRGLREAGCAEGFGPGLSEAPAGRSAAEVKQALEDGELQGLILWDVDPVRDFDDPEGWSRAIGNADFVLASSMFAAAGSDVRLPAETYAEKEGTVTHPDGRLQRVRPSVPHPGAVRPLWQALSELSAMLGDENGAGTSSEVFDLLAAEATFLNGIDVDQIGGMGLRWPELEMEWDGGSASGTAEGTAAPAAAPGEGRIHLGTYRDLWGDYVAERNPALRFLSPSQTLELHPDDAERLGVQQGERVQVSSDGRSLIANVALRERMLPGSGFLI
ncbi:MAG: NADH-quinone oxidoreductase subunit NuoG, partial [Solirubrobacterales bacterium]|nr:NADH-quinone oxidoreductase subunit NuoG [Solirubrobacterales bacterium]